MRHLFTLFFCCASMMVFAQGGYLIFNGAGIAMGTPDPNLVGDNIYIVIGNPDADAIQWGAGLSGGGIISENENHIVKWMTGNTTGGSPTGSSYPLGEWVVPFLSTTGGALPPDPVFSRVMSLSGGSADGFLEFSTYATPASDNLPLPSGVSHLNHYNSQLNNSANVVDRFWCISSDSYTARPDVAIAIFYDQDELDGIAESELLLQRFNPNSSFWMDFVDLTVPVNQGANFIGPWVVPGTEFFKDFVLSKSSDPLPIELLYFNAVCASNGRVLLSWSTASEQDNKEFVLERSEDGIIWEQFDVVAGAGNSSSEIKYEVFDNNPFAGITYYKLTQVDFDGTTESFEPTASDCDGVGFELVNAYQNSHQVILDVSSGIDDNFDIAIYDMQGKTVTTSTNRPIQMGLSRLELDLGTVASGVYTIRLQSENNMATRKIFLEN